MERFNSFRAARKTNRDGWHILLHGTAPTKANVSHGAVFVDLPGYIESTRNSVWR